MQASALVRSDPAYTDVSLTQYASALEWLRSLGTVKDGQLGLVLADSVDRHRTSQYLFTCAIEDAAPPWLADADTLISDIDELPQDASTAASTLGLTDSEALLAVRQLHTRLDLAERARVGAAGETALVELLESYWPNSTDHVSLRDDGLGYDITFAPGSVEWHLEVKSTTRRGRLAIHLSRHEYETAMLDPAWRLVTLGLDEDDHPCAIATVRFGSILSRSPHDQHPSARWDSARYNLLPEDLISGLNFIDRNIWGQGTSLIFEGRTVRTAAFAWMPEG